jgi:hypothetical protein
VVGKRQANKPGTNQPTTDAREDHTITERCAFWGGSKCDRFVAVGMLKGRKPGGRVEDGRTRMALDKLLPTRIFERFDGVK